MQNKRTEKILAFLFVAMGLYLIYVTPIGNLISYLPSDKEPLEKKQRFRLKEIQAPTDIYIDDLAVPYITSSNIYDLSFATGLVQYYLKGYQLEYLRHAAKGELSILLGQIKTHALDTLHIDREAIAWQFKQRAKSIYDLMDNVEKLILKSFVHGINFAQKNYKPFRLKFLQYTPPEWTEVDILSIHLQQMWQKNKEKWKIELLKKAHNLNITNIDSDKEKTLSKEQAAIIHFDLNKTKIDAPRMLIQHHVSNSQISGFLELGFPFIKVGYSKKLLWLSESISPELVLKNESLNSRDRNYVLTNNGECPIEEKEISIEIRSNIDKEPHAETIRKTCHGIVLQDLYPELFTKNDSLISGRWESPKLNQVLKNHYEIYQTNNLSQLSQLKENWSPSHQINLIDQNGEEYSLNSFPSTKSGASLEVHENRIINDNVSYITQSLKNSFSQSAYFISLLNWDKKNIKGGSAALLYFLIVRMGLEDYQNQYTVKLIPFSSSIGVHELFHHLIKIDSERMALILNSTFPKVLSILEKMRKQKDISGLISFSHLKNTFNNSFFNVVFSPLLHQEENPLNKSYPLPVYWSQILLNSQKLDELDNNAPTSMAILTAKESTSKSTFLNYYGQVDWAFHRLKNKWQKNWVEEKSYQFETDSLKIKRKAKWIIELMPENKTQKP